MQKITSVVSNELQKRSIEPICWQTPEIFQRACFASYKVGFCDLEHSYVDRVLVVRDSLPLFWEDVELMSILCRADLSYAVWLIVAYERPSI